MGKMITRGALRVALGQEKVLLGLLRRHHLGNPQVLRRLDNLEKAVEADTARINSEVARIRAGEEDAKTRALYRKGTPRRKRTNDQGITVGTGLIRTPVAD